MNYANGMPARVPLDIIGSFELVEGIEFPTLRPIDALGTDEA